MTSTILLLNGYSDGHLLKFTLKKKNFQIRILCVVMKLCDATL